MIKITKIKLRQYLLVIVYLNNLKELLEILIKGKI